jgi:hypothetical protein
MKKFTIVVLFIFLSFSKLFAGYYTPGTGVKWNLDDLVTNSGGVVTFGSGFYTFNDTVKVRAGDTLYIYTDATVKFALNKSLSVSGTLLINPPTGVLFTPLDTANKFSGVRIDSSNSSVVRKLTMEYSVAFRITDGSAIVDSCIFRYNGLATSTLTNAAVVVLRTNNRTTVSNCQFIDNYRAAIQSGSNISTPMTISNNYFIGNDRLLVNTPQINLANSGVGDTIKIINNTLLKPSTNCGGISFLSSSGQLNAVVTGNVIKNNRYGINVQGGNSITYVRIAYNQIDSNNIQGNPNLGGSGVACSGGTAASQPNTIITGNIIRWNLWGVTIQNRHKPNLGNIANADTSDDGKNTFVNNWNSTTPFVDLYNNTIDPVLAQNNYWNTGNGDSVAMKIIDTTDNTALGSVTFTPFKNYSPLTTLNYGNNSGTGSSLYYFANSLPGGSGSPTQPSFSWRDTTGSTSLIVDGVSIAALGAGTVDNGRYDVNGALGGQFVRFFGGSYLNLRIGTNGIICFNAFDPTSAGIISPPNSGLPQAALTTALMPLWMDLDFSSVTGSNRLSYKITSNEAIVTYNNVKVAGGTSTEYVSFQVVMELRSNSSQTSRIIYQYDYDNTGTDFINMYNANTLPNHLVGMEYINNATDYAIYRFKSANALVATGPLFGSPMAVAFGPNDTQLPVELASFSSSVNGNSVNLKWTTVIEENNSGFEIERKNENSSWVKVGFVNGNGNSNVTHNYSFNDANLAAGKYNYRLKQIDYNGNFEYHNLAGEIFIGVPTKFEISQNYPNPFNPVTKIDYSLPFDSKVQIRLYDITGKEVMTLQNSIENAGYHSVTLNAINLSSGTYFYKISAEGENAKFEKTLKMVLLK